MIGPAVAGMAIAATGIEWAFLITGASFLAVLVPLAIPRVAELPILRTRARRHR